MAPKRPVTASPANTPPGTIRTTPGPPVPGPPPSEIFRTPTPEPTGGASSTTVKPAPKFTSNSPAEIVATLWDKYLTTTPQRTKMIDLFLVFLVGVAGMQFVYCVIVGNYPFNAFLAGFSATVGQFVLTASLRIQSNPANKGEFTSVSPERAFADFVFGSLVLHFFCVNFIN